MANKTTNDIIVMLYINQTTYNRSLQWQDVDRELLLWFCLSGDALVAINQLLYAGPG